MEFTRKEEYLACAFDGDAVTFGVFLATACDGENEELAAAMLSWQDPDQDVEMNFRFSVTACIEDMIELYRHTHRAGIVFDAESRPMVSALRAELVSALARLDEITYDA